MSTVRVFVADAHAVVREGLKALINAEPGMDVVGEAADGLTAVTQAACDPDLVVLEVSLPGLSGVQVAAQLRAACPSRKLLILTGHEDKTHLRLLFLAGAAGYALKRSAASELLHAIRTVAGGGTYLDPALAGNVVDFLAVPVPKPAVAVELSEREAEVVRLIARLQQ